jgi:hypothetical protein
MSHEIRTPLNAIWGLLDLLLADDAATPSQRDMLTSARRSAELLVDLIGDILDFTIIDKGAVHLEYTGFSLRSVIASVITRQHELTQNKAVSIHSQVDDDVPDNLLGDSGRLYQILKHLVGNGIKFTPAGEVAVHVFRAPAAKIRNTAERREIELRFSIRDTGVGIHRERLIHIFDSLRQVDESPTRTFGGLGIGLHIVQRLVVMLGGRIWMESAPGQGTIVHFALPFGNAAKGDEVGPVPGLLASPTTVVEPDATPGWSLNPGLPKTEAMPRAESERLSIKPATLNSHWAQTYEECQRMLATEPHAAEALLMELKSQARAAGHADLATVLFRLLLALRRKDSAEIEQFRSLLERTVSSLRDAPSAADPRRKP